MNKKYKKKPKSFIYRGIFVDINGAYSFRERNAVVFTPDIERYFKGTSGVRSFIDKFLSTYKPEPNGIPF
jgi:hypothetical protein